MTEFETQLLAKIDQVLDTLSSGSQWIPSLVSSLAGVILGVYLTIIAQRIGKLYFYIIKYEELFYRNIMGSTQLVKITESPERAEIYIKADFRNTTSKSIGIRDIHLVVKEGKRVTKKFEIVNKDFNTHNNQDSDKLIEMLNIEGNSVLRKNMLIHIDENDLKYLVNKYEISFSYIDENNRTKTIRLRKFR